MQILLDLHSRRKRETCIHYEGHVVLLDNMGPLCCADYPMCFPVVGRKKSLHIFVVTLEGYLHLEKAKPSASPLLLPYTRCQTSSLMSIHQ